MACLTVSPENEKRVKAVPKRLKVTWMEFGIARLDCMDCRIAHPCGFSFGALYIIY